MLLMGGKKEGVWYSFNEVCGVGDGTTKEFPVPIPAKDARGLIVLRDLNMAASDGIFKTFDEDGKVIDSVPDGYALRTDDDRLTIVFERPPRTRENVSVCAIERQSEDAFAVYPMTGLLQKKLEEGMKAFRKQEKNRLLSEVADSSAPAFLTLVQDWRGVINGDGGPVPCNDVTKKEYLEFQDPLIAAQICGIVSQMSRLIQRDRINRHENDRKN